MLYILDATKFLQLQLEISLGRYREVSTYRIVAYVAASGTEMDDGRSSWTLFAEYVNVRHHVVPGSLLFFGRGLEIDFVNVSLHFGDLLRLDGQAEFLKRYRR